MTEKKLPFVVVLFAVLFLFLISFLGVAQEMGTGRGTPAATMASTISCFNEQRCNEIDQAWQRFALRAGFANAQTVWDPSQNDWVEYMPPPPPERPSAPSSVPSVAGTSLAGCPLTFPTVDSQAVGRSAAGSLQNGIQLQSNQQIYERSSNLNAYGTQELVNLLELAACSLQRAYGTRLSVNDLSAQNGGHIEPHDSHQSGLDADVGFYRYDAGSYSNQYGDVCTLSSDSATCSNFISSFNNPQALEANWQFIKVIQQLYDLQFIIVNPSIRTLLENYVNQNHPNDWRQYGQIFLEDAIAHHDHYHIRIKCPQGDTQCADSSDGRASSGIRASGVTIPTPLSSPLFLQESVLYGALASCPANAVSETIVGVAGSSSVDVAADEWSPALSSVNLIGKTWLGKLSSNGPSDSIGRADTGRVTLLFAPCTTDFSQPIELMYYFHALEGFSATDMNRVALQAAELSGSRRNFVLVFPELPWSAGNNAETRRTNEQPALEFASFHTGVLATLQSQFASNLNVGYISLAAHSGGGKALQQISPDLNSVRPNKITFADADYGNYAQQVYNNYVRSNVNVILNLLVQDPSQSGSGAHQPTCNAINFMRQLGDTETAGWNCQLGTSEPILVSSYKTPGANLDRAFTTTTYPNLRYVPLSANHGQIGAQALTWMPG